MGSHGALTQRAVFLDRDGVITRAVVKNGRPHPPDELRDLEILPDVADALTRLRAAGYQLIVVTNQPDVARGTQRRDVVDSMHAHLRALLPLDEIRVCYHDDRDHCGCRKPEPGLLLDAAHEHGLDIRACFMVGDRWRDVEAGRRAGCATVFIQRHYTERQPDDYTVAVDSLAEAADWILCNRA